MSTDYYWLSLGEKPMIQTAAGSVAVPVPDDLLILGTRASAGPWCYRCNTTLCPGGVKQIHHARGKWYDYCPVCGRSDQVRQAVSFLWCVDRAQVRSVCEAHKTVEIARDEYDKTYTGAALIEAIFDPVPEALHFGIGIEAVDEGSSEP